MKEDALSKSLYAARAEARSEVEMDMVAMSELSGRERAWSVRAACSEAPAVKRILPHTWQIQRENARLAPDASPKGR